MLGIVPLIWGCNSEQQESPAKQSNVLDEIRLLSQKIKSDSTNIELFRERGNLYYRLGALDESISDFKTVIRLDPDLLEAYHFLSDIYLEYFRSNEALLVMQNAASRAPDSLQTQLKLARLQFLLKQYDASLSTLGRVIRKFPFSGEPHFWAGMNFKEKDDTARAINSFQTAVEQDPIMADGWIELGNLIYFVDPSLAERYFDNAIKIDSSNVLSWHAKAYYYQTTERYDQALSLYSEILKRDSGYLDALINSGIIYFNLDSLEQADRCFSEMSSLDTLDYRPYFYRGLIALKYGETSKAEGFLHQAEIRSPGNERIKKALSALKD